MANKTLTPINVPTTPSTPLLKNENVMVMVTSTGYLVRYLIPNSDGANFGKWAQGTGLTYETALANANAALQSIS